MYTYKEMISDLSQNVYKKNNAVLKSPLSKIDMIFSCEKKYMFLLAFLSQMQDADKAKGLDFLKKIENFINNYNSHTISFKQQREVNSALSEKQNDLNILFYINEELIDWLKTTSIQSIYKGKSISIYTIIPSFYPNPEFIEISENGPVFADSISIKSSRVLNSVDNVAELKKGGLGYSKIPVSPPENLFIYKYLSDFFDNDLRLLNFGLNSITHDLWSKYEQGLATPTSSTWGIFLLYLGIHPIYSLEKRTDSSFRTDSLLFQTIFPNFDSSFNSFLYKYAKENDLRELQINHSEKTETSSHSEEKKSREYVLQKITKEVNALYKSGFKVPRYRTSKDVISQLLFTTEDIRAQKKANTVKLTIINYLVKSNVISKKERDLFKKSLSTQNQSTVSKETTALLLRKYRIALFLNNEPNANPNFYSMYRFLMGRATIQQILVLLDISQTSWVYYEQGSKIPPNNSWITMLLALDIHPFYHITPRKNKDLNEAKDLYYTLHESARPKGYSFYETNIQPEI